MNRVNTSHTEKEYGPINPQTSGLELATKHSFFYCVSEGVKCIEDAAQCSILTLQTWH